MELMSVTLKKNENVYDRIKQINEKFKTVNILNTSIAYLLIFKELKTIKDKTNSTLLKVSQICDISYNRLRKISALYKANDKILAKIQLFNKTKGKEGLSAGVVCRILKRKGILQSKIIDKAEIEKWNTSNVDDYFAELSKQKNQNEILSKTEKRHVLENVDEKLKADKLIKRNQSMIHNSKILIENINIIESNKGMSFLSLINELRNLQNVLHSFMIKINNNCYQCKNCNFTFFTQVKTQKNKCTACGSNKINKIRLDGK